MNVCLDIWLQFVERKYNYFKHKLQNYAAIDNVGWPLAMEPITISKFHLDNFLILFGWVTGASVWK